MKSHFPARPRCTRTRFFAQPSALRAGLAARNAWVVVDGGAPLGFEVPGRGVYRVAGGERTKRWGELEKILAWLAANGAERGQTLAVVGGGATLDLGAFAASLYRRGMPLLLVPTTLLGMVDATLGGKTAVDLAERGGGGEITKNFAGTFYPAEDVWVAPSFLATLPPRERRSGAGEVYKTMWLRGGHWDSGPLVDYVWGGGPGTGLTALVRACLEVKADFVARDPLDEKRVREALNFGHSVGHALESAGGLSHGECVLWGMTVETGLLGARGKKMAAVCAAALSELALELPAAFGAWSEKDWARRLAGDKKTKGGSIELSLLAAPGKIVKKKCAAAEVARAIKAFPESFRRAEERRRG